MDENPTFDPDLIHAIFKRIWIRRALDREKSEAIDASDREGAVIAGRSRKRPSFANSNAQKLSSELVRAFVTEAVQRAGTIAEAEGISRIEGTHLERILPQLLLDF